MPTETRRYLDPEQRTGLTTLYAKLFGSVTTPHSTGIIKPTEIGNGYYDFAGLDTELRYTVQEEATPGSQAASDDALSVIPPDFAATAASEAAEAVTQIALVKAKTDLIGTIRSLIRW
jgi:hypothetical protein